MASHSWQCRMSHLAMKNTLDTILLTRKGLPMTENYNPVEVLKKKKSVERITIGHILDQNKILKLVRLKKIRMNTPNFNVM